MDILAVKTRPDFERRGGSYTALKSSLPPLFIPKFLNFFQDMNILRIHILGNIYQLSNLCENISW